MAKTDPELGQKVKEHLTKLGLETKVNGHNLEEAAAHLSAGVSNFLMHMGLNLADPSIQDTPRRIAEMYVEELCYGLNYDNFPKCTTQPNGQEVLDGEKFEAYVQDRLRAWDGQMTREEILNMEPTRSMKNLYTQTIGKVDEMVVVDTIQTISLCEHHFQTITGETHIAYLPGTKLLGLSKFARVVNFFARRPQVQERMTEQVYAALSFILGTPDIGVVQRAAHNCMRARGAMDPTSMTTTSKMGGRFRENLATRQEFMQVVLSR